MVLSHFGGGAMQDHKTLLDELAGLARQTDGQLEWFSDRMQNLSQLDIVPRALPVISLLDAALDSANLQTRPVVQAICDSAPRLNWQQSYTKADGFDQFYLDNYGWFNLVSPEGIFLNNGMRVSIGYWGQGLDYVEHWHEPEEFYLVLAGGAKFLSAGCAPRQCGPGDVVHHNTNQPHSFQMNNGPLIAAAFWRGDGLHNKPDLKATS